MKKIQLPLVLLLILTPLAIIFYKNYYLKQAFLPVARDDVWKIQLQLTPQGINADEVFLPLPRSSDYFRIRKFKTYGSARNRQIIGKKVYWPYLRSLETVGYEVELQLRSDLQEQLISTQPSSVSATKSDKLANREVSRYTHIRNLSKDVEELIDNLKNALIFEIDSTEEKVKRIFDYFVQEVQTKPSEKSIKQILLSGKGSRLATSQLFDIIMRTEKIPSRIVMGVYLDPKVKTTKPLQRAYVNEIWVKDKWVPVSMQQKVFDAYPERFVPLFNDYSNFLSFTESNDFELKILASQVKVMKFDKGGYGKEISKSSSWVYWWNLYQLPLTLQNLFYTLVFIPLGVVLLSFLRNMVGVPTFGIFTPLLLTLFFIEAGALFGIIFFFSVIAIGFSERYFLDKLHLLAVPRLSILLTLMILLLMLYALVGFHYFPQHKVAISVFPIVIMTVIIERFSITLIESGPKNTFKTLMGTLLIAFSCFLVFQMKKVQIFLFTYPEFMLILMGLLILIGDYKGYRLSELMRFSPFLNLKDSEEHKS